MRLRFDLLVGCLLTFTRPLSAQSDGTRASANAGVPPAVVQSIDAIEARFERALAQRDRATLETIVAEPFTWVHASDGRVDSRQVWLSAAARGMALTGQRSLRTEHGPTFAVYGTPEPQTVVRVARVQLVDSATSRESWLRQTHVFSRGADGAWRMASGQGTLMYEGPRLDPALHARYVGTFDIPGGRVLRMRWKEGALLAVFPNGAEAQVFLASPTDEVVRTLGSGHLRFTLDSEGRPAAAALVRADTVVWRGTRRAP